MTTTYVVRANYTGLNSLVTSEDVYSREEDAMFMFSSLRGLGSVISASIMRHKEFDGQVETVVLDLAMSEGL